MTTPNLVEQLTTIAGLVSATVRSVASMDEAMAYVADINDALVELCTPMAPPPAA